MRRILRFAAAAASLAGLSSSPLVAQVTPPASARNSIIVSTAWVAQHLADPNLVLLHIGDATGYSTSHIAGARFVSVGGPGWSAPRVPGGLAMELPSAEDFHAALVALGVSDGSRIVVYQAKKNFAPATRAVLTLNWAGLGRQTLLMDGGLDVWESEGRPTTGDLPVVKPGDLSPLSTQPVIASLEDVQRAETAKGIRILDARERAFYDGTLEGGNSAARNRGHIPGALSVPYSSIYDEAGKLKSDSELQTIFAAAGVAPGDAVITYCHTGQQASSTLLAARVLGLDAKLYDGSMDEWSLKKLPVEATIKK